MEHEPLARFFGIALDPPSADDKTADVERLKQKLAAEGCSSVIVPLDQARMLPFRLREKKFRIPLAVAASGCGDVIALLPAERAYGIAVDIGSTNIEGTLFDLERREPIGSAHRQNPQAVYGSDVLSRAQQAMTGAGAALQAILVEAVNRLIDDLCSRGGIAADEIVAVTVAGNSLMTHFFLGLDVAHMPVHPYVPVVHDIGFVAAADIPLRVHRHAAVYLFPNAGSYVGGDIMSGLLVSGIGRHETPSLFVDVGTNVEVAIGCSDWIMVGAGAAGPALEDGVAAIGTTAVPGAIRAVSRNGAGRIEFHVVGGGEPTGICGSGMIDLIAVLFEEGTIDRAGRLNPSAPGVFQREAGLQYRIWSREGSELLISEAEIGAFLRSKAAMFSFLYVFARSLGMTFRDIDKVYVAGALGCGIDLERAISIGMLPDMPRSKFVSLGNASLRGAEQVLLDRGLLDEVVRIREHITYREMAEDPDLLSVLQGALFIPHTDPELLKG